MSDFVERFASNPLLRTSDVSPAFEGYRVEGVFNPGAFRYRGRIGLVLRVAERPVPRPGFLSLPILDPAAPRGIRQLDIALDDPHLDARDPRIIHYRGETYLTTISYLRLAWSDDGERFTVEPRPILEGEGRMQSFGIEDCRVARIGEDFYLTHSGASPAGVIVGLVRTRDWRHFARMGTILCTDNKDCALFEERVGGYYYCLHRPSNVHIPGNHLWIARSPDLEHWGHHDCIAMTRPGCWDSVRIGAGASPIKTEQGWLVIYHGANAANRYCLGALLLDLEEPARVLARSIEPIMEPTAPYEREGFMPNVVFYNGHLVDGDTVTLYYGASDEFVCGALLSLSQVLDSLVALEATVATTTQND